MAVVKTYLRWTLRLLRTVSHRSKSSTQHLTQADPTHESTNPFLPHPTRSATRLKRPLPLRPTPRVAAELSSTASTGPCVRRQAHGATHVVNR